jgi:hypothetical protein
MIQFKKISLLIEIENILYRIEKYRKIEHDLNIGERRNGLESIKVTLKV